MSEEKPSPVTFHEYDIPLTNRVFLWSSVLLLVVSVWMIWADYNREWKGYARRFRSLEVARSRRQVTAVEKGVDQKALAALRSRLSEGDKAIAARQADLAKARSDADQIEGKWYDADQKYKFIKAELDVARYEVDEARDKAHALAEAQKKFDATLAETEKRRLEFEAVDRRRSEIATRIAAITRAAEQARKDLDKLWGERTRLEARIATQTGWVNTVLRDLPMLDFMAPTLKVQQVVLPQVHTDVNFLTVPKVDRCHTCHAAADKPGFTEKDLAPEFRTHSRAELLIGRNHPVERFGCSGCHAGSGLAMTFVDAAHAPKDAVQEKRWEQGRHWHPLHHWDFPMLPLRYAEAGCINCHNQETRVPGAEKLNAGRELIEQYGCYGCHKIDRPGWDELRKAGPNLSRLRGKVTREWARKWVRDPRSFRPATRMPRFWGSSNTATATATMNWPLRDEVEAEAVTRYIYGKSAPYAGLARAPSGLAGDPARGKWVVENRGCLGCHVIGGKDKGDNRHGAGFGPDLNQVGSKLTPDWLYAWVIDPKAMWPDTRMPDLRLTEKEALDAAAYLGTLKDPEFEGKPAADVTGAEAVKMVEALAYEYLRKEATTADASNQLEAMDESARYDYLGAKLVNRYGCFGCHDGITGFEDAQRIGTELTTWASKLITQLDFGLVHLDDHTKHDWARAKLLNPRVFDHGKVESKDPQDLLKMPDFQLTEAEADLILTNLLGFQRDYVLPEGHRRLDFAQAQMEKGRRVIRNSNCQGCHVIEDQGGGMEKVVEGGKPFAPPVLVASFQIPDGPAGRTEQGARVQPDWLFEFLMDPAPIRPWLNLRMPTFGFTDDQATRLIEYFVAHAKVSYPYSSFDPADLPDALVADGQKLFDKYGCVKCHLPLEEARKFGYSAADLAPNLDLAKKRLRHEWLEAWLTDPQAILKDTKMPGFFYSWDNDQKKYLESLPGAQEQIQQIRAYLQFHGTPKPAARLASGGK